jgi:hypothetical protein
MADLNNFRESLSYRNQLARIMEQITVEKVPSEVATFEYGLEKYGGEYIRLLHRPTSMIHFINPASLKDENLKFYFTDYAHFFSEIERIEFTPMF